MFTNITTFKDKKVDELLLKHSSIVATLYQFSIRDNYTINPDNSVSITSGHGVNLFNCNLKELPLVFDIVDGFFDCDNNRLTSMVGGPKRVNCFYTCCQNNIMTFHGFPEYISDGFYCANNPIYDVWKLFEDESKVELLNEMNPLRVIDDKPYVIIDIMNDFLSVIGKREVKSIFGYINI